jgi:hypothetical protein
MGSRQHYSSCHACAIAPKTYDHRRIDEVLEREDFVPLLLRQELPLLTRRLVTARSIMAMEPKSAKVITGSMPA